MSLTKAEIVGRVAEQLGCVKKEAEDYFESVITIIKETVTAQR
jgi:nucleoid DNA-binding protein